MRDELGGIDEQSVIRQFQSLNRALMLAFIAVSLALVYWSVWRAPGILSREDNPRLVEAELRIQRGRILDRKGSVLAETTGPADQLRRNYAFAGTGPAVGYYSFRHGTAGAEEIHDVLLRGQTDDPWQAWLRQLLHQPQTGREVQLTLDAELQSTTDSLMGAQIGAVLLLGLPDAEVLAMASHPGYDPNQLDARFDDLVVDERAPLLNRATQGLYQPGLVLQPLILAAAMERGMIELDGTLQAIDGTVEVNGTSTGCTGQPPQPATWADVLIYRCPAPLVELAQRMSADGLADVFADFGLLDVPQIALNAEAADPAPVNDLRLASVGQENLTVTPLQVTLAWAALGIDGRLPLAQLVASIQDEAGAWVSGDQPGFGVTAVSPAVAINLREALPRWGEAAEFATLALSGPEGTANAWYLGMTPAQLPRYAVVVVAEESTDLGDASGIGRALLAEAMAAEDSGQ